MTSRPLPSSVACPKCGVPSGRKCMTKGDYPAPTHAVRWKVIGIAKPTLDDRNADWDDWVRIAEEHRVEAAKEHAKWWNSQKAQGLQFAVACIKEHSDKGVSVNANDLARMVKAHVVALGPYSEIIASQALKSAQ